jgi:hypothetical protein
VWWEVRSPLFPPPYSPSPSLPLLVCHRPAQDPVQPVVRCAAKVGGN